MRRSDGWIPLAWYLAVTLAVPLVDGARLGDHAITTLLVAAACFAVYSLVRRLSRYELRAPRFPDMLPTARRSLIRSGSRLESDHDVSTKEEANDGKEGKGDEGTDQDRDLHRDRRRDAIDQKAGLRGVRGACRSDREGPE
jgi:hypothetical protein